MGVFYVNNGMVSPHKLDWLKHSMNVLVGLFRRYCLEANVTKSRKMTYQSGALQAGMSEETMVQK